MGVRIEGPSRVLKLADGHEVVGRALIIATGIAYRKLDVPGLEKLQGAGVHYYAPMSEAFSHRDGEVYIVGGANSAGQAAMYFSGFARQVTMVVRGESLFATMSQYLEDQIKATKPASQTSSCDLFSRAQRHKTPCTSASSGRRAAVGIITF